MRSSQLESDDTAGFALLCLLWKNKYESCDTRSRRQLRVSTLQLREPRERSSLLREYRTRLIADVVTGKLDVREAARSLPTRPTRPSDGRDRRAEDEADDIDADRRRVPDEAEA